jgi:glycosyltransferase involved in cell wall biosynthesis
MLLPLGELGRQPGFDVILKPAYEPISEADFTGSDVRGIPVVASDVVPYREFIQDGVTGFLVRHEHEWLKRISELAADDGLRESMGMAARNAASAWVIEAGWRRWASAYESL